MLTEDVSKAVLDAYGIPVTRPVFARTAEDAVAAAEAMGYPVVLKIQSPDISHKTDVGGVVLDLGDSGQVTAAFRRVMSAAAAACPGAWLEGVAVQPMIRAKDAVEMILGAKKDPTFGAVIMAGMGGTTAELFGDRALGFPPLNERLARRMLESLKIWPLLRGYRGRPAKAVDKLIEAMIRLSYLIADHPEIKELDINPLLVSPSSVVALDARIAVDHDPALAQADPFSHLALRPYPEHYVKDVVLEDGSAALLRPIKPEDESMWLELLAGCSRESIYSRFRYFFHWESHEVAARYCYIDYDRELAIVAESREGGSRRLMGVGRLVADPMKASAEYAVLVGDAWQDKGLGGVLTDYCLEIARDWGVRKITAVTTANNPRMVAVFKKRGFAIRFDDDGSTVEVDKDLN
jgi:acetyltransferase